MKKTFLLAPMVALSGCGQLAALGITPQTGALAVAIGAETRAGANCIRERESGRPVSELHGYRIRQGRHLFDATLGLQLSEAAREPLSQSRADADAQCPVRDNPAAVLANPDFIPPSP